MTFDEWLAFYGSLGCGIQEASFYAALELGLIDGDILARDDIDESALSHDELVVEFERCGYGADEARRAAFLARDVGSLYDERP